MPRVPILSGTRLVFANAPDDALVLRPPPPTPPVADAAAAVRDALRFPIDGEPLDVLARGARRATIVVEPPALPVPGSASDPRRHAVTAVVEELERLGIATGYQTILVACGLARRTTQRELAALVTPELARRFHGNVTVHDAESPDLVPLETPRRAVRVNAALVDTDLVVVVTAAESVLHGGPAALVAASGAETQRAAGAYSLLETTASQGWHLGVSIERALGVPLIGVSLALEPPSDRETVEQLAASPARHAFALMPGAVRRRVMRALPRETTATAAFAGPPSVAHAEALLRTVERRRVELDEPLDVLVVGVPRSTPFLPRERPNPLLVAFLGLGVALRLWRDGFPVADDGTVVLVNGFTRHFAHPTQQPYRAFFHAIRSGRDPELLAEAERGASADARALDAYRAGRTVHPLLPYRDWNGCQPALGRIGAVIAAGAADASAVRQLGFVPAHGIGAALELARGRIGGDARVGFVVGPPYFPLGVRGSG